MPSGLDVFTDVVADFRSVAGVVTKGAIAVPLADYFLDFGPTWPRNMPLLTAVAELVVLICVFEYWYGSGREKQRRRMRVLLLLLVFWAGGYLYLLSQQTFVHPVTNELVVHGWELRGDAQKLLLPGEDAHDLLEGAEYHVDDVWTSRSTTLVRLAVIVAWLGAFCSLAAFIAVFVSTQRRRTANRAEAPRGAG